MGWKLMAGSAVALSVVLLSVRVDCLRYRGTVEVQDLGFYTVTAYLGVLHHEEDHKTRCGKINVQAGYLFFEAVRYAVGKINSNASYLFGKRLGYRVLNTCKDTIVLKDLLRPGILEQSSIGVIGPPTSDEAIFSSPIFNIFGIPMVSHLATAMDLEDRERYGNFFRTVPSDSRQVKVLIEIVKAFNWTYLYVINSHGNFGEKGIDVFVSSIANEDICIAKRVTLISSTNDFYYQYVIDGLMAEKNINVVILYTSQEDTIGLLRAAKAKGVKRGRYTWIASTSFSSSISKDIDEVADGAIFLGYETKIDFGFFFYMIQQRPERNNFPWFRMFWEEVFRCSLNANDTNACTGNESLFTFNLYEGGAPVSPVYMVIEAVYTFACGVRMYLLEKCPKEETRKSCVNNITYAELGMKKSIFKGLQSNSLHCGLPFPSPKFSHDGSVPGQFRILNFQYNKTKRKFENVGHWEESSNEGIKFVLHKQKMRYGNGSQNKPEAVCAKSCQLGEIRQASVMNPKCCWTCNKCALSQFVFNNTCLECPNYQLPTKDMKGCYQLPVKFVDMKSGLSIVVLVFCLIGIKLTTVTFGIFLKYWDTHVVKASSRELSTVMIVGLYMCFMSPIFFLTEPTFFVCAVRRFIVGVCLTTCYTPLLLKTNRIYRIFDSAKKGLKRPTFISPRAQIMISVGLIGLQCLLVIALLAGSPPRSIRVVKAMNGYVELTCYSNGLFMPFNLALCCVLMLCCTYFAFKTRKFPKNYNESRSIGITMYVTCLLWGIFVPLYASSSSNQVANIYYLSLFCILIAYVTLVGLFGQRVYILLFVRGGRNEGGMDSSSTGQNETQFDQKYKTARLAPPSPGPCQCRQRPRSNSFLVDKSTETDTSDV